MLLAFKLATFVFFISISALGYTQDYVDLLSVSYGHTLNSNLENEIGSTSIEVFDVDFLLPVPVNDKYTFLTGGTFNKNRLDFLSNNKATTVYSSLLKIGVLINNSETFSSNFLLLPKLASDYKSVSINDFRIGAIAIFNKKKSDNLKYRFGLYASTEAFGVVATPFFGWFYSSNNDRFIMDVLLPISANINYNFKPITIGFEFSAAGKSFNINENAANIYADQNALTSMLYLQKNIWDKSLLLRLKWGYAKNNFEAYAQGDKVAFRLPGINIKDKREQLNPDIQSSFLFEFELLYRFNLSKN